MLGIETKRQALPLYLVKELLDEFVVYSDTNIDYEFVNPTDEEKTEEDESSKENDLLGRRNYERLDYE